MYCSVMSLGGNVNTRRMSKPDYGIHLSHKKSIKYFGHRKFYVNDQNFQNLMLLTSSDTKRNTDASIIVYKFLPERTGFNTYTEYNILDTPMINYHVLHLPSISLLLDPFLQTMHHINAACSLIKSKQF